MLALCLAAPALQAADAPVRELLQPPTTQIPSPITDRFEITGLYSFDKVSTEARYDPSATVRGTNFFAEKLLGMDDTLRTGTLGLMFRLTDRGRVWVDYFKLSRHGDTVINQSLTIGNTNYLLSDRLITDLDLRILGLSYGYSFLKTERFELGAGLGVHIIQASGAGEVPVRRQRDTFDGVGALPSLLVDGTWRFAKRFSASGRVQYLAANINGIDGSFTNYDLNVQFRAWKNLALGAGYAKKHVLVSSTDPSNSGRVDFQVKGPELFLRASF